MDNKKIAKRLNILWWLTFIIVGLASGVIKYYNLVKYGVYIWEPFSNGFQLALVISVIIYFIPLMVIVNKNAKVGRLKNLFYFSRFLLAVLVFWTIGVIFLPQYVS